MKQDRFIPNFRDYFQQTLSSRSDVNKAISILKYIIKEELPRRDSDYKLVSKPITNAEDYLIYYCDPSMKVFPMASNLNNTKLLELCDINIDSGIEKDKDLTVNMIGPDWGNGWKNICDASEIIYHEISTFFYLSDQYYYRSKLVSVIGALAIVYKKDFSFFGHWGKYSRLNKDNNSADNLFHSNRSYKLGSNQKRVNWWIENLNGFDPYINRICFQYIKGIKLMNECYFEEAIVSFDNIISISVQFLSNITKTKMNRDKIFIYLELPLYQIMIFEKLYKLRCNFGAHPSSNKWWDFYEIYEDFLDSVVHYIDFLIAKIVSFEIKNRSHTIELFKWSEWFNENSLDIYESVWFHKLP